MTAPSPDCPPEADLLRWVQGDRPSSTNSFQSHLDTCDSCRRVIVELLQATDAPAAKLPDHATRIGRFIVLELLGAGAMGEVFSAYDPQLDRRVALKLVHLKRTQDAEAQGRLLREARAGAALAHPNVVTVFDAGFHQGELFIAMEQVDGGSLSAWLREKPRAWREVVAAFAQAGLGLAAAHHAGWIHRDLKPANILMTRSGRAMISDFGLASAPRQLAAPQGTSPDSAQLVVTHEGALVGSPAYMAPELRDGSLATAQSDQFSFCVSLHEGLFGVRPFEGDDVATLFANAAAGKLKEPPGRSGVPDGLLAIVRRGLQADPSKRFPSIDALLAELARFPSRRAQQKSALAAVAVVALLGLGGWQLRARQGERCADDPQALSGVWDEATKLEVKAAFEKANPVLAPTAFAGISSHLDGLMSRWVEARRDNCEATSVRGEQSVALLDLRTQCLHRRREEARTLTQLFKHADDAMVARAITAAGGLSDVDACSIARVETSTLPPPAEPAARARYDALSTQLAEAKALMLAGRLKDAEARFAELEEPVTELGHPGLRLEVLRGLGTSQQTLEHYADAEKSLKQALHLALAAPPGVMGAEAALTLVRVLGELNRTDEALEFEQITRALLQRLPPQPAIEVMLNVAVAGLTGPGSLDEAAKEGLVEKALVRAREMGPGGREYEATALNELGNLQYRHGDFRGARQRYEGVAAIVRELFGADHPKLGIALYNNAGTLRQLGDYAAAHAVLDEAEAIWTRNSGPEAPMIAAILGAQGITYLDEEKLVEAEKFTRRSLDLRLKVAGPQSRSAIVGWSQLYDVLVARGAFTEAEKAAASCLAVSEKLQNADGTSLCLEALGTVTLRQGDAARAVPMLERAQKAWEEMKTDPRHAAGPKFMLAQALWRSKGDRKRAIELAKSARTAFTEPKGFDARQRKAIDEWLAAPK